MPYTVPKMPLKKIMLIVHIYFTRQKPHVIIETMEHAPAGVNKRKDEQTMTNQETAAENGIKNEGRPSGGPHRTIRAQAADLAALRKTVAWQGMIIDALHMRMIELYQLVDNLCVSISRM